jgi:hypothetical protein
MNPTTFYATLGLLVNEVLQRILDEIMDQLDISEEESIRLNKLCKSLHGLEELFESDMVRVRSALAGSEELILYETNVFSSPPADVDWR